MDEIILFVYLIGFAFTAGWAVRQSDFNTAMIVAALWVLFWPARIMRIFG